MHWGGLQHQELAGLSLTLVKTREPRRPFRFCEDFAAMHEDAVHGLWVRYLQLLPRPLLSPAHSLPHPRPSSNQLSRSAKIASLDLVAWISTSQEASTADAILARTRWSQPTPERNLLAIFEDLSDIPGLERRVSRCDWRPPNPWVQLTTVPRQT